MIATQHTQHVMNNNTNVTNITHATNITNEKCFYADIPAEQQRLLDLKYIVNIRVLPDGSGWNADYSNHNQPNKKVNVAGTIQDDCSLNVNRNYLQALLTILQSIYKLHPTNEHSFINIEVISNNVYLTNLIREWLKKWATNPDELVKKPNGDLLAKLKEYKHLEAKWISSP